MTIIRSRTPLAEIRLLASARFDNFVKAVVDVERRMMAVGADLHSDEEAQLLDDGSQQQDLWGINLYPDADAWIEFDSMINLRPSQGNRSRGVDDPETRRRITEVVHALVQR